VIRLLLALVRAVGVHLDQVRLYQKAPRGHDSCGRSDAPSGCSRFRAPCGSCVCRPLGIISGARRNGRVDSTTTRAVRGRRRHD
jgi:hypothetical protein